MNIYTVRVCEPPSEEQVWLFVVARSFDAAARLVELYRPGCEVQAVALVNKQKAVVLVEGMLA